MATCWENSCSFGLRYVSWYKCLIVSLVFSHLGFWSGNLFLIAPFPDLCLLVPFYFVYCISFLVYSQIGVLFLDLSLNTLNALKQIFPAEQFIEFIEDRIDTKLNKDQTCRALTDCNWFEIHMISLLMGVLWY